jgi:chaperonin GroEL
MGRKLESVKVEDLGEAERVTADKDNCIIIGGKGKKQLIEARIKQIKKEIETTDSEFDREKLEERLAKLSGGVAVINVGAATEIEMKEKQERVKDAVGATKAAIEEGIIPGGGVAILEASQLLDPEQTGFKIDSDEAVGVKILKEALKKPIWYLAQNAGKDGNVVIGDLLNKGQSGTGFNVLTGQYVNMIKAGIIDPVKVTRSALQNAVSVAAMILTTECLITDLPEKEEKTPGMPPGGMGEM